MSIQRDGVAPDSVDSARGRKTSSSIGRRSVLVASLAFGGVFAMVVPMVRLAHAGTDGSADGARGFVTDLAQKAIAVMADHSLADAQRVEKFRVLFVASFDLVAIGRLVLGRHWQSATTDQQAQFLKLFEQQQVLTWSGRFKYFSGQNMTIDSADADASGGWLVGSRVNTVGGKPIPVDWAVVQSSGIWHVSDIVITGVSLALTLRQDFGAVLLSNDGKFDALLTAMQNKIDQLRAG
jgi:phospholipid transport system substrate-binding protein